MGTASSRVVIFLMGGVTGIVVSRGLHPSGRGSYSVIITVASMAMVLGHLSIEQSHVYLWSQGAGRKALAANAVWVGLCSGAVAAVVAWILVRVLGPSAIPIYSHTLLAVALLAVPAGTVALYMNGLLILDDRIGRVNASALVGAAAQCVALVALAVAGKLTVGSVVVVWALATALPLVVTIPAFGTRPRDVSLALARRAVGLGLRYHIGMAAVYLLFRVDVLLLNARVSRSDVGLYSLAVTLAEMTYLLTDSVAQVMLPRQISVEMSEASTVTARVARSNFLAAVVALVGIACLGPFVVPLVFGSAFSGAVPALLALGPGILALATVRPVGAYLIRLNRPFVMSAATGTSMVVNIALNLMLIPVWGIVGASVASSVAYTLLAGFYLRWMARAAGVPMRVFVPRLSDVLDPVRAFTGRQLVPMDPVVQPEITTERADLTAR
jgi:O-antigen/teichoic acid export membrane protein